MFSKIALSESDIDMAIRIGLGRMFQNRDSRDKAYYKRSRMIPDCIAGPYSVACEIAVARAVGLEDFVPSLWAAEDHSENSGRADVGEDIEVRWVRYMNVGPAVRKKDRGRYVFGAYASPSPPLSEVTVLGYTAFMGDVPINAIYPRDRSGVNRCPISKLKPVSSFVKMRNLTSGLQ